MVCCAEFLSLKDQGKSVMDSLQNCASLSDYKYVRMATEKRQWSTKIIEICTAMSLLPETACVGFQYRLVMFSTGLLPLSVLSNGHGKSNGNESYFPGERDSGLSILCLTFIPSWARDRPSSKVLYMPLAM